MTSEVKMSKCQSLSGLPDKKNHVYTIGNKCGPVHLKKNKQPKKHQKEIKKVFYVTPLDSLLSKQKYMIHVRYLNNTNKP